MPHAYGQQPQTTARNEDGAAAGSVDSLICENSADAPGVIRPGQLIIKVTQVGDDLSSSPAA